MKGYYNDPEATATALRGGWFHTGDAAVVHPDGYVEIRDRIKDVIISGGENISSVEVEGVLLRHPAVQEVAVVGMPDEQWGEAPHAFVVLQAGRDARPRTSCAQFARDRLAHFKAPHAVTFVAELPKTATGKIQKYVLRGGRAGISRSNEFVRHRVIRPCTSSKNARPTSYGRSVSSPVCGSQPRRRTSTRTDRRPNSTACSQLGMKMSSARPFTADPVSITV